jgi:hypothetical protein
MLESSKDILNIVIAFSVAWVALFLGWTFFYIMQIVRQGSIAIKELRDKIKIVDSILKTIKEKLEHTSSHMSFLVEAVRDILKFVQATKERRATKRTSRKKKTSVTDE